MSVPSDGGAEMPTGGRGGSIVSYRFLVMVDSLAVGWEVHTLVASAAAPVSKLHFPIYKKGLAFL